MSLRGYHEAHEAHEAHDPCSFVTFVCFVTFVPASAATSWQRDAFGMFAQWDDESALDFLDTDPCGRGLNTGWDVRLRYLRRYGCIAALGHLPERAGSWDLDEPIVAVTIARMKLRELPRFLRWAGLSNEIRFFNVRVITLHYRMVPQAPH
jgi:hypothetical protein